MNGNSLIPTDKEHDAHYCTRQCLRCQNDMDAEEVTEEAVIGDDLCRDCRALRIESRGEEKYALFASRNPNLKSLFDALVPNQLSTWTCLDMEDTDEDQWGWRYRLQHGLLIADFKREACGSLVLSRQSPGSKIPDWEITFTPSTPQAVVLGAIQAALATGEHETI